MAALKALLDLTDFSKPDFGSLGPNFQFMSVFSYAYKRCYLTCCFSAANGARQDLGRVPHRIQELPEQQWEEAGPAGDGEPLLWA